MVGPAAGQKSQLVAKSATPVVTEIDADKLKKLLQRDTADARPLLVNFWATWCGPCREEYPDLVKLDSQFKGKGLDVVTISLDDIEDIKTKVPEFLTAMHAQMPAYLLNTPEPEAAIAAVDTSWSGALPATFLYNGKGEVVYKTLGRIKPAELSAAIEKTMSEK
jgi:thiol-disulfide isomerase/thioredoxin